MSSLFHKKKTDTKNSEFPLLDRRKIKEFNNNRQRDARVNLCNAPFRNLYFDTDGSVYVCCYNQKYPLGKFPENSLREIWNSGTVIKIREHIGKNDLSYGCDECRTALQGRQFLSSHIPFYDNYFDVSDKPNMMELQISNHCNLECTMCSEDLSSGIFARRMKRKAVKSPYDNEFILQLDEFLPGMKYIMFSGGEPFVIPMYYDLWERLLKVNPACNLMVQTNGTVLNDKIKSILEKGNFHIGISIDSLNERIYQDIRINANLKDTLNNITYFSDYCHRNKRFIGISFCPMQQNWEEIPDMMNFCNKNNIEIYFNTVWYPGKNALWVLDTNKLGHILNFLKDRHVETSTSVEQKNSKTYNNLILTFQHWRDVSYKYDNNKPSAADKSEINVIENDLLERICNCYVELNELTDAEKKIETEKIISRFKKALDLLPDDELKMKSLAIISGYKEAKILSDIFREDDEGLFLLIKNIYKLAEIK